LYPNATYKSIFLLFIGWFATIGLLNAEQRGTNTSVIKIGVLAPRGIELTHRMWRPTADYLEQTLSDITIEIIPLKLEEADVAVRNRSIDLILTNPGNYIELEAVYGISRILTMQTAWRGKASRRFGAVIFTRADNVDIKKISDLKGRSFMGVNKNGFGGFQMAWGLLKSQGIDPFKDFSELTFSHFPQQDVVRAVKDGLVDAGTVRTDILEHMAVDGEIQLSEFLVLNQQHMKSTNRNHLEEYWGSDHGDHMKEFPFLHSTRLFPEWPLAKLRHTPNILTEKIAMALLKLRIDSPAAKSAMMAGWTIPLDYTAVHDLFRNLGIGPYKLDVRHVVQRLGRDYWHYFILIAGVMLIFLLRFWWAERTARNTTRELFHKSQALSDRETRLSSILESTADGIITIDEQGIIESFNAAAEHIFGYSADWIVGRKVNLLMSDSHSKMHDSYMKNYILTGQGKILGVGPREVEAIRRDGSRIFIDLAISEIALEGERLFIGLVRDITERKKAKERLNYLANHDVLTGLPNRNLFNEQLITLKDAQLKDMSVSIFLLDLDNIKSINDTLGHKFGDLLIKAIAERLKNMMKGDDYLARFGGDEFIVMSVVRGSGEVLEKVKYILEKVQEPLLIDDYELIITTSIGVSIAPAEHFDIDEIIRQSDTAMYRSKEIGRNSYMVYSDEFDAHSADLLSLEHSLRYALERQEFFLCYQPQVEFDSNRVIGVEALIRWAHPTLGLVGPDRFIPLLETTGLIQPVGEWVLRTACEQLVHWHMQGFNDLRISVNVSSRQFNSEDFFDVLTRVIQDTAINPAFLDIELTEGVLMEHVNRNVTLLHAIKELGIKISVDDFGTGYSSLAYLKRFPIDILKIDRAFVSDLETDPDSMKLAKTIIDLASNLDIGIIAEGTETKEQVAILKSYDCNVFQGYFFSKPLPNSDMEVYLNNNNSIAHL